jgi:SAM-dependent methyltransferase
VLDIGAGSGRDLAHFAALGHPVAAAEPIAAFRAVLAARLPDATLFDAGLPDLPGIDSRYDLILVNAVWQHLPPEDRTRAFARLAGLLASGGCLALSLRHGPAAPAQGLYPLDATEETARATAHGLHLVAARPSDLARAPGVTWTWLVLEPETRP